MDGSFLYLAALSANTAIGPKRYQKITESFNSLESFFQLKPAEQADFLNIRGEVSRKYFNTMLATGEIILKKCQSKGIHMVSIEETDYPARLKFIPDAPFLLYRLGNWRKDVCFVGIVGTRHPTPEALEINSHFTKELSGYGIGIASGLAKGHDMAAQKTALEYGGYTAAVLGCGIDIPYPKEAESLYYEIMEHGVLFSEYPPETQPLPQYFPLRNRIISGLSEAVLVIQAPEKSGSLITARYAEVQGREVFAVPGNPIIDANSGSNKLIREGAKMALSAEEIAVEILGGKPEKLIKPNIESVADLNKEQKNILSYLQSETSFDELIDKTGYSVMELNHILTSMEIQGVVLQYPGRYYVRNLSV